MSRFLPVLVLVAACGEKEPTTLATTGSDTDTETTPGTDTDTQGGTTDTSTGTTEETGTSGTTAACAAVNAGTDWAWRGECPQMLTPCEIQVTGCELTITYSSGMTMGMPSAGIVTGSDVQFNQSGPVTGCVGTVIDADTIEGTCDGCTYTLTR